MIESSLITGKVMPSGFGPGMAGPKPLYIKIFPGAFTLRPPRLKQSKLLLGELLVRYSGREWPEKKNGPLLGDQGVLTGISALLSTLGLTQIYDISYAKSQRELKEHLTIQVGTLLAKEIADRGWVHVEESLMPMASRAIEPEPDLDFISPTIAEVIEGEEKIIPFLMTENKEVTSSINEEIVVPKNLDSSILDLQQSEPKKSTSKKIVELAIPITKKRPPSKKSNIVKEK